MLSIKSPRSKNHTRNCNASHTVSLNAYWRKTMPSAGRVQGDAVLHSDAVWDTDWSDATTCCFFLKLGFPDTFPITWLTRCSFPMFLKPPKSCKNCQNNGCINYLQTLVCCFSFVSFSFNTDYNLLVLLGVERVGKRNIKKINSNYQP